MIDLDMRREAILLAFLAQVPFDGFTLTSLKAGTEEAGYKPGMDARMFPAGMLDVAVYFSEWADQRMIKAMAETDKTGLKQRERITAAIRARLDVLAHHREAVRHAASFMALPQNAPVALRCLYRTVDAVWHALGDTSTDFSWYTKRASLAGVYSMTILYWLNDDSDEHHDTWEFLHRRIDNTLVVPQLRRKLDMLLAALPAPFRPGKGRGERAPFTTSQAGPAA